MHATVDVVTTDRTVRLRSNEQLVSVGGSNAMPKYTLGPLLSVDGPQKTAVVGLGSLHKIETGDQFEIGYPKGMHWRLTITGLKPHYAFGTHGIAGLCRSQPACNMGAPCVETGTKHPTLTANPGTPQRRCGLPLIASRAVLS